MAPPEPAHVESWITIAQPAIGLTLVAILGFVAAYFKDRKDREDATPAGDIAKAAVGAAIPALDRTATDALLSIKDGVERLVEYAERRAERQHDDDILQRAIERLRKETKGE